MEVRYYGVNVVILYSMSYFKRNDFVCFMRLK
jgi:hypothetical protein